nr:type II toxin-antitoxin system RelE/ParE family toxin [Acidiferrobacter sp.]
MAAAIDAQEESGGRPQHLASLLNARERLGDPEDMDLPGARLHPLSGEWRGYWAVNVSGNWRLIFRFEGAEAHDVDYRDYH